MSTLLSVFFLFYSTPAFAPPSRERLFFFSVPCYNSGEKSGGGRSAVRSGGVRVKIKTKPLPYEQVMALPRPAHRPPRRPDPALRALVRLIAAGDLKATHFTWTDRRPGEIVGRPSLILMNHSSFIDLEMVSRIFRSEPYDIVCTSDGFVGKEGLMRAVGCIPTRKFVTDVSLVGDMRYALRDLGVHVLLYPEASYSFDGTATPLPRRLGVLLKRLAVPVVMVKTAGAFTRDPLYNCLQKRQVDVSADVYQLFSEADLKEKSVAELDAALDAAFTFDHFAWQRDNHIEITEPFRADGLNRILFQCPHCLARGRMEGRGTAITCGSCGASYELDTLGRLVCRTGEGRFDHIPDWYAWERRQVAAEIDAGSYLLDTEVDIGLMVDYKAIYMVGAGRLRHDAEGFRLTGCGGKLDYRQGPGACYSVYSDYYWYEIGDVICIGDGDVLYYCFPKEKDVAARTRMAVEELYRRTREKRKKG